MTDKENYIHSDITGLILKAFFNVYNKLGYGFLEKVYENSMMIELRKFNLICEKQVPVEVFYGDKNVGQYFADIVVNNCVIIEIKAADNLAEEHEMQLVNYLRATDIEVGMLLNFGREPQYKRKVFTGQFKNLNKS